MPTLGLTFLKNPQLGAMRLTRAILALALRAPCGRRLRRPAYALTRGILALPRRPPCGLRLRRPAYALACNIVIARHASAVPPAALDTFRTLFQNQAALTRAHPGRAPFGRPFGRRLRLPVSALMTLLHVRLVQGQRCAQQPHRSRDVVA